MAKSLPCIMVKKGSLRMGGGPSKKVTAPVTLTIVDNGDCTGSIMGTDSAGNSGPLDPTLFTLALTSDNTAVMTADAPVGLTFAVHVPPPPNAPLVGATCNLNFTVAQNDGAAGPFPYTVPVTIAQGPTTGVIPVFGPVTTH